MKNTISLTIFLMLIFSRNILATETIETRNDSHGDYIVTLSKETRTINDSVSFKISKKMPAPYRVLLTDLLSFILFINGGRGTPLHQEVFGEKVEGLNYLRWLDKRVESFEYKEDEDGVLYYAKSDWGTFELLRALKRQKNGEKIELKKRKVVLYKMFFKRIEEEKEKHGDTSIDYLKLAYTFGTSALLHEARHSEGYFHVNCETFNDELKEMYDRLPKECKETLGLYYANNCDGFPDGAFGIETIFTLNFAKYNRAFRIKPEDTPACRIISVEARNKLNLDLIGPMNPRSLGEMIAEGDIERVKLAIRGAGVPALNASLKTAIDYDRAEIIELLLNRGASFGIAKRSITFNNHFAYYLPDVSDEMATKLIKKHGYDINRQDGITNMTPLHWAVLKCKPEKIKTFLELGADPNLIENVFKETPLGMNKRQREHKGYPLQKCPKEKMDEIDSVFLNIRVQN